MVSFALLALSQLLRSNYMFLRQDRKSSAHLLDCNLLDSPSLSASWSIRMPSASEQISGNFYIFCVNQIGTLFITFVFDSKLLNIRVAQQWLISACYYQQMGKFNNHRKNNETSNSRQMFFDTIKDMRKLIQKNTKSYTADTLGLGKKTKVPYSHLIGRRKAIKDKYKAEKARAHEESIQYDSSMQLLNSHLMSQKRQKDQFEKNKYKFEGSAEGRIGRENEGFLEITKRDLDRIYGSKKKEGDSNKNKSGFKGKGKGKGRGKGKGMKNRGGKSKKGHHKSQF